MLTLCIARAAAGTYLPLAIGAAIAGVLNLAFLLRVEPTESNDSSNVLSPGRRQLAVRIVCSVYVLLALLSVVTAVVVGGIGAIVTAGLLLLLAVVALLRLWSRDR